MASTILELRYSFAITSGGRTREWAQPFVAPQLTLTAEPDDHSVTVAASATATLWDATAGGNLAAWGFALLRSDADFDLKVTLADASTFKLRVSAGVPFVLGSNIATGTGSASTIAKFEAVNPSSTASVTVNVVLAPNT